MSLLLAVQGGAFDPAFMAAIQRPWPDLAPVAPSVVASGMAPPDTIIP